MRKIVTLGEIMLRLSTAGNDRILQSKGFNVNYGGGEANVAISLSNFGVKTEFVTKLPKNDLAYSALRVLKENGVGCENIVLGGERMGVYFLEVGCGVRGSNVIYDRKNSAFSKLKVEELDLESILKDVEILHLSGITPALSDEARELTFDVMKKAKEMGVKISFDFNYRSKLWSVSQAKEEFEKYLPYIDICFAGILDCKYILQMGEHDNLAKYYERLKREYPNIKYLLSTKREVHSVSENSLKGYIYSGKELVESEKYDFTIVDRVGGGDAFVAGALYGIYKGMSEKEIVEFAIAASVYKHSVNGDANLCRVEEIESFMRNGVKSVNR